jgi:predicted ATPase
MKKIVLTGGTYAGKTSLIELFKRDKYKVIPDIGLEVIEALNKSSGKLNQQVYRSENPVKFYSQIISKQIERESEIMTDTLVCDRGVHDYIVLLKTAEIKIPPELYDKIQKHRYDIVFVCDTLKDFDERKKTRRSEKESQKVHDGVLKMYKQMGCKVILVKEMPLIQRYKFIQQYL